jgi:hypothetical protein
LEEKFNILSKKGKELLENFGWKEEQEDSPEWDFKPTFI